MWQLMLLKAVWVLTHGTVAVWQLMLLKAVWVLTHGTVVWQEDHGLKDAHRHLALLEQSACLGNMDATFTLATFLNNGVGTTIQERKVFSDLCMIRVP